MIPSSSYDKPACRCGKPIPRELENWRYFDCSDPCQKIGIAEERERSRLLKEEMRRPVQLELGLRVSGRVIKLKKTKRRKRAA